MKCCIFLSLNRLRFKETCSRRRRFSGPALPKELSSSVRGSSICAQLRTSSSTDCMFRRHAASDQSEELPALRETYSEAYLHPTPTMALPPILIAFGRRYWRKK
ncbi:hypothetical protein CO661_29105 [Sinorhizobium fredii]|uniref:Uncharacterized protein n=1 Tax=Rhizobium fredii TaxID=380 RepID=A0A2A6LQA0_RHIFR|nr:hypothetical protein CO661_29105 [Sinorhizobium fredii]